MRLNNDVLQRLDAVEFPSPPVVVSRLSQLLSHERTTAEEISAALELDATMAVRVLRLANSVVLGGGGNVSNVQEAVLRVGVETVRDIVFALSMVGSLRPVNFEYRPFWRHSLAVAHTARLLQDRLPADVPAMPEAYTAGLLHDIGMLVFDRALGSQYKKMLARARTDRQQLHRVEAALLGLDHAEAGARMLTAWDMPERLIDAARWHHDPEKGTSPIARLVYLADLVCNNLGFHHGTGYLPRNYADPIWAQLGLEVTAFPQIAVDVRRGIEQVERVLAAA